MRKGRSIKVFAELRDLEIFDCEGELCGVADEVEFDGAPGQPLRVTALLVGPGAWRARMPSFLLATAQFLGGRRVVRVPWDAVKHVTSRITLNRSAEALGLNGVERRLQPFLQRLSPP